MTDTISVPSLYCNIALGLNHVCVYQILEPMEETRTQLIMVTEPVFASSLDLLNRFEGLPGVREPVRLSELDCKAGLLQASTLAKYRMRLFARLYVALVTL